MKVAAWNVNSARARLPHLLRWLAEAAPDVALLQETKTQDKNFPFDDLQKAGYHCAHHGQPAYNGVAILSKTPLSDVVCGMPQRPQDEQARVIAATAGNGVRVVSVYVPNGQSLESDKYRYKLEWLADFAEYLKTLAELPAVVGGDYNIAPAAEDIYDAEEWGEGVLASPAERRALQALLAAGFADAHRLFDQPPNLFSWWDYRQAAFRRNRGLRIDLLLLAATMQKRCLACAPDSTPRKWERPSDHAPVVGEFA
jgi:exodeoxyribonuclease-3